MSAQVRVRKAKFGNSARPWVVRGPDAKIIARYPTGAEALAFVRRLLRAAG